MLIREDDKGLFIRGRFGIKDRPYRPGVYNGHSHAVDTTDGGLKAGDKPKTVHTDGEPSIRITLESGKIVYWFSEDTNKLTSMEHQAKLIEKQRKQEWDQRCIDGATTPSGADTLAFFRKTGVIKSVKTR